MGVALTAETEQRLEVLFLPEDRSEARALLVNDCGNNLPFLESATASSLERIRFAVLKLSGGDLTTLCDAIALAQTDWRDALIAADFADDASAHSKWWPEAHPS